eukprot:MONOS_2293.1-p1 / transcript=MONOS_2293.1 / gene=MONOS_2293 / organism=Monocercomonoides_exilis_PA203 / gene_product=unspecified product / transcript_product=unspecified product / location=Mono_scaffold00046:146643-147709(-) / protein_length=332 / sequence_SO=supercontig / SO=protein_coding / is_pseudo=false
MACIAFLFQFVGDILDDYLSEDLRNSCLIGVMFIIMDLFEMICAILIMTRMLFVLKSLKSSKKHKTKKIRQNLMIYLIMVCLLGVACTCTTILEIVDECYRCSNVDKKNFGISSKLLTEENKNGSIDHYVPWKAALISFTEDALPVIICSLAFLFLYVSSVEIACCPCFYHHRSRSTKTRRRHSRAFPEKSLNPSLNSSSLSLSESLNHPGQPLDRYSSSSSLLSLRSNKSIYPFHYKLASGKRNREDVFDSDLEGSVSSDESSVSSDSCSEAPINYASNNRVFCSLGSDSSSPVLNSRSLSLADSPSAVFSFPSSSHSESQNFAIDTRKL